MKTRITRTVASLALATALLSGVSSVFAATPDIANPALDDLGALGDIGATDDPGAFGRLGDIDAPGDLGVLGSPGDVDARLASPPILGSVESIPSQAVSTGRGIVSPAVPGAGLPGLPFRLP